MRRSKKKARVDHGGNHRKAFGDLDRLSNLPTNIIEKILGFLPLKEAVQTNVLSSHWKDKWLKMPRIVADNDSFKHIAEFGRLINYVLTRHEGQLEKFSVSFTSTTHNFDLLTCVSRLSQKGVQDLELSTKDGLMVPHFLFYCKQLVRLTLCSFEFPSKLPDTFEGFSSLISLNLHHTTIDKDSFQTLIAGSPHLEELELRSVHSFDNLQINSRNLKYFCFHGEFESMHLNTPLLADLSVNHFQVGYEPKKSRKKISICGWPTAIQRIYLQCNFHKFLAAGNIWKELVTSSNNVMTVELSQFCFRRISQVSFLLSLIKNSPNLQTLNMTACTAKHRTSTGCKKFWEGQGLLACSLSQLRDVKFRSFSASEHQLSFIQFLLANAPFLKEMNIESVEMLRFNVEKAAMAKLMHFSRASPKAEINYTSCKPPVEKSSDSSDSDSSDDQDSSSSSESSGDSDSSDSSSSSDDSDSD